MKTTEELLKNEGGFVVECDICMRHEKLRPDEPDHIFRGTDDEDKPGVTAHLYQYAIIPKEDALQRPRFSRGDLVVVRVPLGRCVEVTIDEVVFRDGEFRFRVKSLQYEDFLDQDEICKDFDQARVWGWME